MKINDKENSGLDLLGFAVMRYPSTQTTAGYLYPYGPGRWAGEVAVLDEHGYFDYRPLSHCIF
ncbi:putative pyrophosphatase [Salmonella phage 40]|nr:putative pyrophosphatase [Salmonella phage 40]